MKLEECWCIEAWAQSCCHRLWKTECKM